MVEKSLAIWGHLRFVLCTFGSLVKEKIGDLEAFLETSCKKHVTLKNPQKGNRKNNTMGVNSIYSRMVASATGYIHYVNISIRYIWYMNMMYVYMYVICIHKYYIHLHIISTWGFRISAYVAVGNNPVLQPDVVGHPEIFMSLGPLRDVRMLDIPYFRWRDLEDATWIMPRMVHVKHRGFKDLDTNNGISCVLKKHTTTKTIWNDCYL